jgi:galactokinase
MQADEMRLPQSAGAAFEQFATAFADEVEYSGPLGAAWAPGRVNLIGEHTDYNEGFVLPLAVDRVVAFAGRARQDDTVRLWSGNLQEHARFSLEDLPASFEQQRAGIPKWSRYALGVVSELAKAGVELAGFDAVVTGDVPLGGGMSSSAALEVATAQACALFSRGRFSIGESDATLLPMQVAAVCQRAEQIASNVRCGILDQAASCLGKPGKAVLIDCRSFEYRHLPFDAPGLSLVVIDTSIRRELSNSAYNERRQQCEAAARLLREIIGTRETGNTNASAITALRDVSPAQFARYGAELPALLRRRAGYVISEDARVLQTVKLLEQDAFVEVGRMLWRSHAGLRDDYEVSCFELDTLVEIAQQGAGVLGARMLGAGFGGCTINLVRDEAVEALRQAVEQQYPERTGQQAGIDICRAAGGPGYVWVS